MKIEETLFEYENDFLKCGFCSIRSNLDMRIDDKFVEIGASGKVYNKANTIATLLEMKQDRVAEILDFHVDVLSEKAVIARYKAYFPDEDKKSFRTSVWKYIQDDWRLFYHQGTYCK